MKEKIYIHTKTGNLYKLIGTALDCTNSTEGRRLVLYTRADIKSTTYARELTEFLNKFKRKIKLGEYIPPKEMEWRSKCQNNCGDDCFDWCPHYEDKIITYGIDYANGEDKSFVVEINKNLEG